MLRLVCFSLAPAVLALSALLLAPPAFSQAVSPPPGGSFAGVLSGTPRPLTLTLKDLNGSWRTFTSGSAAETSSQVQAYLALLTGGMQNTYYTQGETVTLGGEVYLVTYHQKNTVDYAALLKSSSDTPPPAPKPTPDTVLSLTLLNLRLAGSLNDIQAFSLQAALNPPAAIATPDPEEVSVSNLKQIGLALTQYTQDYDEKLPPMKTAETAKTALCPYVKSNDVFEQPPTHTLYQPNTSLSGRTLASFSNPSTMVIYYEATPAEDGLRAVLFLDGHVTRVVEADWQRLKSASHVPNQPQTVQ